MALGMSAGDGWLDRGYSYEPGRPAESDPEPEKFTIAIVRPDDRQEVYAIGYEIGDHFRRDVPVIINLEELTAENATRVVDFVAGTIFGRRGEIERLSSRVFLIVPPGSTVIKP